MKLYLSRHSFRLDRITHFETKQVDPCLHWTSINQVVETRNNIKWIDYVFTSPFLRCVQTAYYYNCFDAPMYIETGLAEILFPRFFDENPLPKLKKNLKEHYHTIDDSYKSYITDEEYIFPENRKNQKDRVCKFLDFLVKSKYWNNDILLVGHGGSIGFCLDYFGVKDEQPAMGQLYTIDS